MCQAKDDAKTKIDFLIAAMEHLTVALERAVASLCNPDSKQVKTTP